MKRILITGGAGFIGSNLVEHNVTGNNKVTIFDNLSRPGGGSKRNIKHLLNICKDNPNFSFIEGDVRDFNQIKEAITGTDVVFHVAAQTAVTTSIDEPIEDFEINARGTFNVLEAVRQLSSQPVLIYTSTNKVYGDLTRKPVELVEKDKRWDFAHKEYSQGIDESYPLDFEAPYGCSKGIGDAYCLDYARTFGLKTVVFRMSAIYGLAQHPTEDQGWVAWFIRRAMEKKPITIYGDGKQVRDILFVDDLVNAFDKAVENIDKIKGQAFNIGGGRANSLSIIELLELLENDLGIKSPEIAFADWRRADQKVYISNTNKAKRDFDWKQEVKKEEGIGRLYEWMKGIV